MRRIAGALVGILAYATATSAGPGDACGVAAHLVQADAALPRVAEAIKARTLTIAVAGTASSSLPSAGRPDPAYPARLQAALQHKLPDVTVKVISFAKPRQTAAEMASVFPKILKDEKPALIIWQTGTVDAMRGIATETFQGALEEAVVKVHDSGADIILMNPQFNPRTEAVINTGPYTETMRFVALGNALNLFDRQSIMRQWGELGTFDLMATTKSIDTAAKVHDCIGRLLADLILEGVKADAGDRDGKDKTESGQKDQTSQ